MLVLLCSFALAGALRAIADGDGAAVRDAEDIPAVGSTLTLPAPLAHRLVQHAGIEQSDDGQGWRTRDGRESPEPRVAVTDALVAIAEDDLTPARTKGSWPARSAPQVTLGLLREELAEI